MVFQRLFQVSLSNRFAVRLRIDIENDVVVVIVAVAVAVAVVASHGVTFVSNKQNCSMFTMFVANFTVNSGNEAGQHAWSTYIKL